MNHKNRDQKKIYLVTDTSWWLDQGWKDSVEIAKKTPEVVFVIPAGVMRELDGLKRNPEKGRKALASTKRIEELVRAGRAKIETKNGRYYNVLASKTDEEVVRTAKKLKKKGEVFLLTTDKAQLALARQEGIDNAVYEKVLPNKSALRYLIELILITFFLPAILLFRIFFPAKDEKQLALGKSWGKITRSLNDSPVFGQVDPASPWYDDEDL